MLNTEARTVDEGYASACGSTDLRTEIEHKDDTDMLRAAAGGKRQFGHLLLRLHTEWDSAEHPTKPTKEAIEVLASTYGRPRVREAMQKTESVLFKAIADGIDEDAYEKLRAERLRAEREAGRTTNRDRELARREAWCWYVNELELLMGKLKVLPRVRDEVIRQANVWGWQDAERKAPEVLGWWLHQTCPLCGGTKWQAVKGTGRLSARTCPSVKSGGCGGTGLSAVPHKEEGKRLAYYLDECLTDFRGTLRKRLGRYHSASRPFSELIEEIKTPKPGTS